ncbi:AbrB/MazE/SpoVT family DNA-binding domain-containing protein [Membranihabitans maritimus]|uniref:AbrB/MazE/SpoVT family DNA-binding domain-containing protein n=1 Tax=Membranihabitans maritimus TaxID=2904244 RepID=UPI001F15B52C|nr:AbrB/MazE/SpoVT family DNA-binding domain-containing protein [Membranihabitans maritimus]
MEANIIKIGNSKGIIIPANIIKLLGLEDSVQLEMENEKLIVRPSKKKKPREGWEESFKKMHENGDDELLIPDVFEDEDFEDWTW